MEFKFANNLIPGIKQRFNEEETHENRKLLTEFYATSNLRVNNKIFEHLWFNSRAQ